MPRRFTNVTREIWALQPRLAKPTPRRAPRLLEHPRFRAAYDFLLLRAEAGEPVQEAADWWTRYLEADAGARDGLLETAPGGVEAHTPARKRRRRGGRRRAGASTSSSGD
jgi:poly(A) polymerase